MQDSQLSWSYHVCLHPSGLLFTFVVDFHPSGRKSWQGIRGHNWSVPMIYDAVQTVHFLETSYTQNRTLFRLSLAQFSRFITTWKAFTLEWSSVRFKYEGFNHDWWQRWSWGWWWWRWWLPADQSLNCFPEVGVDCHIQVGLDHADKINSITI